MKRSDLPAVAIPAADWFLALRRRLVAWFKRQGRDLPWRREHSPYTIWLSEVMLQQTTVAMALPHYARFVKRFPNLDALAAADEHEVLRLWEGLGYYRRARQLHAAARHIVAAHGGAFPRDFAAVRALPGVGRYTAGAVLSFAFDEPWPILEANTIRVWARLLACADDPLARPAQDLFWAAATAILPRRRGGRAINLALMDLGATVCVPREPRCDACPIAALCHARQQERERELPRSKIVVPPTAVREAAVVVRRRGRVLVMRYNAGQRWAGLWDFPRFPLAAHNGAALRKDLVANVVRLTGVTVVPGEHLTTLRHVVTRYRITLECFTADYLSTVAEHAAANETRWVRPADLAEYALNVTGRKLARLITQ